MGGQHQQLLLDHRRAGGTAYFDNATHTAETINRCHRSASAEAYLGTLNGYNLACSGAKTSTYTDSSGYFKPGLDFYDNGAGRQGQATMLQSFAGSHNVRLVVVSIGGNDFNFASVVQQCVTDFLGSPSWWKDYCYDDSSVKSNFTAANVSAQQAKIATALQNLRTAMRNAGYADNAWTLLVQTYPPRSPTGRGSGTPSPATPGRAPAAAASGTPTPTGPTPPRCRRSTAP
ncbi:MAG: hypothetical protein R2731_19515 [Nocardioides sp.]